MNIVTLDVRDDIRKGQEPFSRIMKALGELQDGQALRLLAPFEPVPLFGICSQKGFSHSSSPMPEGDYEVMLTRREVPEAAVDASVRSCAVNSSNNGEGESASSVDVDARGLEPPQPLVKILEALSALPEGAELRAFTDRRPMHLYAQIEARGFVGRSEAQADGSFVTYVRRR